MAKSILQKIIILINYRLIIINIASNTEIFKTIFTINDHISDNSIQINIKFTFTVYEYVFVYEYIFHYPT